MIRYQLTSFAGVLAFALIAWGLSTNRRNVRWRPVLSGYALQFILAALVFSVPGSRSVFLALSNFVTMAIEATREGIVFVFGSLGEVAPAQNPVGFTLAFQALPFIVIFSALMGLFYYIGFLPFLIRQIARFVRRTMETSGAESLCAASNIFVGIESVTTIRPYLAKLTRSEAFLILTVGMSTVASSVMALYVALLGRVFPTIAGHLISASLLSVPAAVIIAKLMEPETETPVTGDVAGCKLDRADNSSGWLESVANGAAAGGKLAAGVALTLLAFIGLLGLVRVLLLKVTGDHVSVEMLLGWCFYPFTFLMGVPWADVPALSELLGMRLVFTEVPSYLKLAALIEGGLSPRSAIIGSYALCGFAHIASAGIFVGGIGAVAPEKLGLLSRLGLRALIAATLVTLMTGAMAGIFCTGARAVL